MLRGLRKSLGWNQKRLAQKAGIDQATISRVESGQLSHLRSDALDRLATVTGVTTDFLLQRSPDASDAEWEQQQRMLFVRLEGLDPERRRQLYDYAIFLEEQQRQKEEADENTTPE